MAQRLAIVVTVLAAVLGTSAGTAWSQMGPNGPVDPRTGEQIDPRLFSETAQHVMNLPGRLQDQFPAAYAGVRSTTTNQVSDGMVFRIVEGAPGIDELRAEVERTRQYSLDRVGFALTYSYEPVQFSRARRIQVHTELASELETGGPIAELGMITFRPADQHFIVETRGRRSAVAVALRDRYPDVEFDVQRAPVSTVNGRSLCRREAGAETRRSTAKSELSESGEAAAPLSARLEVADRCVQAGSTTEAVVVVLNRTAEPIEYPLCGDIPYASRLVGEHYEGEEPSWLMCRGWPHLLPVGESRWPIRLWAAYSQCSRAESEWLPPAPPACVGGTPPPLPPGKYQVDVFAGPRTNLPIPAPVTIEVS